MKEWEEEMKVTLSCSHSQFGSCLISCPWCKIIGFYGPRVAGERKYRACKFCGWWQEVGEEDPYRCTAVQCLECGHADSHKVFSGQTCRNPNLKCGSTNKIQIPWAIDQSKHPAWDIKNEIYNVHGYQ
ncbi:MAG: hypothetical protein Q8Q92_01880 [bacterium]|nr:hypothetical protein [bacterium]